MDIDPAAHLQLSRDVVRQLQAAGYTALWAGGCVRDLLLGKDPKDYDVATDARPETVRQLFGYKKTEAVGASFGVILVRGPRSAGTIEVATFRLDGEYLDGRRPSKVVFCTPEEDARRRDFTINGMFYDPETERVFDYVGGQADLRAGIVRAIGDPRARFEEDKLRLLRAVRFTARLDFALDPTTADALRAMAPEIHVVSAERIAQELRLMLGHPACGRALTVARDTGLLTQVLPETTQLVTPRWQAEWDRLLHTLARLPRPTFEVVLATILSFAVPASEAASRRVVTEVGRRLRLSNKEVEHAGWLLEQPPLADAPTWRSSRLKRLWAHPLAGDFVALERARAEGTGQTLSGVEFVEEFVRRTPLAEIHPPPLVTGNDLIRAGWKPGPDFKRLLNDLYDAQLEGEVATQAEALALAQARSGRV